MKNSIKLIALAIALTSAVACGSKKTSDESATTNDSMMMDSANNAASNMVDSAANKMNATDSTMAGDTTKPKM